MREARAVVLVFEHEVHQQTRTKCQRQPEKGEPRAPGAQPGRTEQRANRSEAQAHVQQLAAGIAEPIEDPVHAQLGRCETVGAEERARDAEIERGHEAEQQREQHCRAEHDLQLATRRLSNQGSAPPRTP